MLIPVVGGSVALILVVVVASVLIYARTKRKISKSDDGVVRSVAYPVPHDNSNDEEASNDERPANVTVSQSVHIVTRPKFEAAAAMYRLDVSTIDLGESSQPVNAEKTLASSHFRSLYDLARCPEDCVEILQTVKQLVILYAQSRGIGDKQWQKFYKELYDQAWQQPQVLQGDVAAAAEYVWTSGKTLLGVEFCAILNAAIRADRADEMVHAAMFTRAINQRRIQRVANVLEKSQYPLDGKLWRGTSFDDTHRSFFRKNVKYRAPGFVASSLSRTIAGTFIFKVPSGVSTVEWCILVDPRGATDFKRRCRNASYVAKTHLNGEGEYLFAPFSVFTVRKVKWNEDPLESHSITVAAAVDNALEPDDLPLSPWY